MSMRYLHAISAALSTEFCYQFASAAGCDQVERKFDLNYLNKKEMDLLSYEILVTLKRSNILKRPEMVVGGAPRPQWGTNVDDYFQIVRGAIAYSIGLFELREGSALNIPFPIYEIIAKRVFERLEEADLLVHPYDIDRIALLRIVLFEAGEIDRK